MEAIANAGDITITGDRKAVTIIRKSPTGVQMHDLDLTDINVMNSPYFIYSLMIIFILNHLNKTWEPEDGYRIFRDRYHCCHWQQRPSSCYLEIKTDIKKC
jgi:hypothetical protein